MLKKSQIVLPTGSLLRDPNPAVLATRAGFCQRRAKLRVTLTSVTATRGEDADAEGEFVALLCVVLSLKRALLAPKGGLSAWRTRRRPFYYEVTRRHCHHSAAKLAAVGFAPTPLRHGALGQRRRPVQEMWAHNRARSARSRRETTYCSSHDVHGTQRG